MNHVEKYILVLATLFSFLFVEICECEIINRVVAYVDDQAITLRDFNKFKNDIQRKTPDISNNEIIELMINRKLLLKRAKDLFAEGDEEDLLNNYIDLKVKSQVIITENQIRDYYEKNKEILGSESYHSIRDQIEKYLFEKEFNRKLKDFIQELRNASDVKINFIP